MLEFQCIIWNICKSNIYISTSCYWKFLPYFYLFHISQTKIKGIKYQLHNTFNEIESWAARKSSKKHENWKNILSKWSSLMSADSLTTWIRQDFREGTQKHALSRYVQHLFCFVFVFQPMFYFNLLNFISYVIVIAGYMKILLRAFNIDIENVKNTLPAWKAKSL